MQLIGKLQSLDRVHGVIHTMSGAYRLLSAQHHFWVVDKIPVDGKSVLRLSGLSPFRHDVQRAVPFWRKMMSDTTSAPAFFLNASLGRRIAPSSSAALGKIAAHGGVLGVHGIAGGHKSYHAAGTHLVQCFGEKVVVNTKVQLVVGFVVD